MRQPAAEAALVIDNRAAHEICGVINELMFDRLRQGLARVVGKRGELFQEAVDAHVLQVEMQPDEALARRAELLDVTRLSRRRAPLLVEAQHENAAGNVHVQGGFESVEAHGRASS